MKRILHQWWPLACCLALPVGVQAAGNVDEYFELPLEQLLQVETPAMASTGARSGEYVALRAVVPTDVITAEQLQASGQVSLLRALAHLVPGFNAPMPSIADGTDHVQPFTLRGLNPDQVLVLVNGKRLHQGALLHNNGTIGRGSTGVDLATISLPSVERVEIMRDGAGAQYGSDAIAGVVNVILKGYGQTSSMQTQYGQTRQGDGMTRQVQVFHAQPLAGDGFFNLGVEWRDQNATNRAGPDATDHGQTRTHFGQPDSQDALFTANAELPRADKVYYLQALLDHRYSRAGAFRRNAQDDRNIPAIYPDGFLPQIAPRIQDHHLTLGMRGLLDAQTAWDLSYTHGRNNMHFFVENSLNASLGLMSPRQFDSGALRYTQQSLNLDLTHQLGAHVLAWGYEYRHEAFRIAAGEPSSYALGEFSNYYYGAQGFPGFTPENAQRATRQAHALYGQLRYAWSEPLLLIAAARAENYSDFGSKLNGKLALRYQFLDHWWLRASGSTGFRAPSLAQSHFSYTGSYRNLSSPDAQFWGNYAVDHPLARALGARDLQAEKSRHFSMGMVFQPSRQLTASFDLFSANIDQRILSTGYISAASFAELSPAAAAILQQNNVDGAVYFTNAVDTRTQGLDARLDYQHEFHDGGKLKLVAAWTRTHNRIHGLNDAPAVLGVSMADLLLDINTRNLLENAQPRDSFSFWSRYSRNRHALVLNLKRHGAYKSVADDHFVDFPARWTLDAEYSWTPDKTWTLTAGVSNLFNTRSTEWGATQDALTGSGKVVPYSQYSPIGYNGAYQYIRVNFRY